MKTRKKTNDENAGLRSIPVVSKVKQQFKSIGKQATNVVKPLAARAKNVLQREQVEFRVMPWCDLSELIEVRDCIYSSFRFEADPRLDLDRASRRVFLESETNPLSRYHYARDRLELWKLRCRNILKSQIIVHHLTSIESMLNILIEEFNFYVVREGLGTNQRLLYDLYSIGVINFCNVLSSYSEKNNILSIRNLAKILQCPSWIVTCRHTLSHPNSNPPSLPVLHAAISFALSWMDANFWTKLISEQTPANQPQVYNDPNMLRSTINNQLRQIHPQICELLFTAGGPHIAILQANVLQFSKKHLNEFICLFGEVLVFEVSKHENITPTSTTLPSILLRRSLRIFETLLNSFPSANVIVLLINHLLFIIEKEHKEMKANPTFSELKRQFIHTGFCWLLAIMSAVIQEKRVTEFEKCFASLGSLQSLRYRYSFTWLRALYRFLRLDYYPTQKAIFDCFVKVIHIPQEKLDQLTELVRINSGLSQLTATGSDQAKIRTCQDLPKFDFSNKGSNNVFIGASMPPISTKFQN